MIKYRVRLAELADLAHCLEIDASYVTTHVWQLQESFEEPELPETEETKQARSKIVGKKPPNVPPSFRMNLTPSRLPRPLAIPPPMEDQHLLAEWKKTDFLLIAETLEPEPDETDEDPTPKPDILGYLGLTVDGARHIAWITSHAVQIDYRRQGIGTQLLSEARAWADRYRLRSMMIELQTKNFPAISFFQKNGFFFCGYNNAYYTTREIALFFGKRLEKFS